MSPANQIVSPSLTSQPPQAPDTITIIRARRGKRLAKLIRNDGSIADYDSAYRFDLFERQIEGLNTLASLLLQLTLRPDCAVVRGQIIDPARTRDVRRLAYRDNETGDEPTLREATHLWLALDMDGVERPDDVPPADLARCAAVAAQRLPRAFHGARCIAQATAAHGIKPGCRMRLWYWLTRPATSAELTYWLRGTPADPSVFGTVQPIYTAAPVFAPGMHDHLRRILMPPGRELVEVPCSEVLKPRPLRRAVPLPLPGDTRAARYAFAALTNAATRIRQASIGTRHHTILHEARGLSRFVAVGLLTEQDIETVLHGAGEVAGKPEREIASVIAWAMAHPSATSLPQDIVP